jgi:signal transduction histidine kinase
MKIKRSLKNRITKVFVLLTVALASFFTLVSYSAVEYIEGQLIDGYMEKLAGPLIARHKQGQGIETPPEITFYANDTIPEELQYASAGIHEAWIGPREVQVLLINEGKDRYVITHDMNEFEQTEFVIFTTLAIGFLCSVLLAAFVGVAMARRIIQPVSDLATAVGNNAGPTQLPALDHEDEIGLLARAFARRTDELQGYLTRERLFTGDVSHELRTPLTIMMGAAEMLQVQLRDNPGQYAATERIRRVAAETSERVSALLLLSRNPEQQDAPQCVLNAVIQSEIERYRYLLDGKPVKCLINAPAEIIIGVRPELAGIAIGNLLRNAFQHTDVGHVSVRLSARQLVIEDTGPGIPPSVRSRLFERFVRAEDNSGEGIGLGLSIVKRVAEHVGWTIALEDPPNGGSRFVLAFPS